MVTAAGVRRMATRLRMQLHDQEGMHGSMTHFENDNDELSNSYGISRLRAS
jgi:hypothetical protein